MSGDWQAVAARMVATADALDDFSRLYEGGGPDYWVASANRLRSEAVLITDAESL